MNEVRIPKKFHILGHEVQVDYEENLVVSDDSMGKARYLASKIVLQPKVKGVPISSSQLEETYLHEVVHFIFYHAMEDQYDPPLHEREALVSRVASILHQVLKTSEY